MKISVTKNDIKNGVPLSECKCPIALAIKRKLKTNKVHVEDVSATILDQYIMLPSIAVSFIKDFDCETEVLPFSFNLDIVND